MNKLHKEMKDIWNTRDEEERKPRKKVMRIKTFCKRCKKHITVSGLMCEERIRKDGDLQEVFFSRCPGCEQTFTRKLDRRKIITGGHED